MQIPLIFVHKNNNFYLRPVLEQVYLFNQNAEIYLLGDNTNNKYPFISHHLISDYSQKAENFEKIYMHYPKLFFLIDTIPQ